VSLLEVRNLRKSYDGHVAVDGLSFEIEAGEIFGLLGPNGAGKTTTMLVIAGLLKPDAGDILFQGKSVPPGDRQFRRHLGVVPQNLAIYPDLTARENLDFFGRLYGLRGKRLRQRIADALDLAGLAPRADDAAGTFSGGMKRRLNFAVALLHEPSLLILDEPTVGVDPQSRAHLLNCVRELGAAGTGVIYASHYMEEVQAICHRAAIIDHGRLLACGPMSELLQQVTPGVSFRVPTVPDSVVDRLEHLPNVTVAVNGQELPGMDKAIRLAWKVPPSRDELRDVTRTALDVLTDHGITVSAIETQESNLEELFLRLTGHRLRD